MEDKIEINRPKSKTMSLIERRSATKPQLSCLQFINKRLQQNIYGANPNKSLASLSALLNNKETNDQDEITSIENLMQKNTAQNRQLQQINFQLVKEIDQYDHVFSPLKKSTKYVKQESVRHRLNTGEYLSANENYSYNRYQEEETYQKSIKPQHGIFQRYYRLGKKIGEGAHSVVRECSVRAQPEQSPHILPQNNNKELVVKIMKYRDTEILFQLLEEEKIMNEFRNNPNLVRKVDFLIEKQKKTAYLVMERANGSNLTEILRQKTKLSEFESKLILKQAIQAIDYLHKKNICHRDITNNNIIYDESTRRVKIIDFSVSKQLHKPSQMLWTNTGSIGFMAPEIFTECNYDKMVDMWSVGVVAHSLVTGYLPFYEKCDNQQQLIQAIIKGQLYLEEIGGHLSPECIDFLIKCLEKDPSKRLKPSEALNHPWINKIELQQLSEATQPLGHRKSLIVTSMTNIEEGFSDKYQKEINDFECIYINRLNFEFKHLRAVNS
ncbi:hypothetical protein ABPG72_013058 [Tetrahymena utriculariae]